jgi:hypothetical protein
VKSILLIFAFCIPFECAHAQWDEEHVPRNDISSRNAVYVEYAGVLFLGSLSLNYESELAGAVFLRVGAGVAYTADIGLGNGGKECSGFTAMMDYISSGKDPRNDNHFEPGLGASLVNGDAPGAADKGWFVRPAIAIGYRYQPMAGGLMFRVGATWVYSFGLPFQASIGYAF